MIFWTSDIPPCSTGNTVLYLSDIEALLLLGALVGFVSVQKYQVL